MTKITVKVGREEYDGFNPRKDYENAGTMACWHNRYKLGDVQPSEEPADWLKENAPEGSVVLPLYLYDHSGITIRASESGNPFSCRFDSGQVGFLVITPEEIKKGWGEGPDAEGKAPEERAKACLESEVKEYDEYLQGNVFYFVVEEHEECCECGSVKNTEVIDSCGGFLGVDWALDAMKEHVEDEHHAKLEEAWNNL